MAVLGRCLQNGCSHSFDDGEHMEDVILRLRSHFRREHRTKAFRLKQYEDRMEVLNATLDEAVDMYAGAGWRERVAQNPGFARNIQSACTQICRYHDQYREEVVRGAQALSLEHGREIPDPYVAPAAGNLDGLVDAFDPGDEY